MKYITTPIYYVNGSPHIAHAYTTLAADVLVRYFKLRGDNAFFLTGTDEHGAKIAEAAEKSGKTPQQLADDVSAEFAAAWELLNIQPDGFIRTTNPKHKAYVQRFLQELYDAGHIYKGEYKGLYCVGCEEFKTESQIGPDNTCPIHLKPLTEVAEESYMFKLSAFTEQLIKTIKNDTFKIQPEVRKNEVLSFITSEPLRDVAISRKNVAWGVTVPWDESHTVYVWVDALLNYLSAADSDGPEFASGKRPEFPPVLQLVGKDILRFHAVIWPCLLLAAGKELPKGLFVHGFFTVNGHKMSKSLGNVITPQQLIDRYGVDGSRYLLLSAVPFGNDGDLALERLDTIYNSELANNLGNLVNRVQAMITRYRDGKVPQSPRDLPLDHLVRTREILDAQWQDYNITGVLETLRQHVANFNAYIEQAKPWELAKSNQEELDFVLANFAVNLYILAGFVAPILPTVSESVLAAFDASIGEINYGTLGTTNHTAGKQITPIAPLFPRLDV